MDLRLAGAIRPAVIVMAGALSTGRAGAQVAKAPAELAPVLERAGRYVLDYEERFQNVAAVETRTQPVSGATTVRRVEGAVPAEPLLDVCIGAGVDLRCVRATEADVVFVRLEGERGFRVFRDVFKVNTMPVRVGELRLERLFADRPAAAAVRQAGSFTELSRAAYNVGPRLREPRLSHARPAVPAPRQPVAILVGRQGEAPFRERRSGGDRVRGDRPAYDRPPARRRPPAGARTGVGRYHARDRRSQRDGVPLWRACAGHRVGRVPARPGPLDVGARRAGREIRGREGLRPGLRRDDAGEHEVLELPPLRRGAGQRDGRGGDLGEPGARWRCSAARASTSPGTRAASPIS